MSTIIMLPSDNIRLVTTRNINYQVQLNISKPTQDITYEQ